MRRSGIYGRCSFRDDRSQAACCGERFCAVVTTADGSTGNTSEALNRLNIRVRAHQRTSKPRHSCGLTGGTHEISNHCSPHSARRIARRCCATALPDASLAPTCDNDARCTEVKPRTPDGLMRIASGIKGAAAAGFQPPRAFDANGNRAAGIVLSRKTGARARVGVAYAARFQAYIDDLETQSRRPHSVHGWHSARAVLAFQRTSVRKSPGCVPAQSRRG